MVFLTVPGDVEHQEDFLPDKSSRQDIEEAWKQVVFEVGIIK
jgi:hypothetical protein